MNKLPLVSIIIPTYKRSDTLARAINSVLNQNYENKEIVVVDDNNPDTEYRKQTEAVMLSFQNDSRVKYIKHEKNKNGSAARNTGFRNSKGEFIMFLDDDDEFLNNKIEAQVRTLMERDQEWGACYTKYVRMYNGKLHSTCKEKAEGNLLKEELMRDLWLAAGSNLMIRRSVMEDLNGFDESFIRNQDVEFVVRFFEKYKLAYTDVLGLCVNVHTVQTVKYSFEEVTKMFLQKFGNIINSLPREDADDVYQMINLQLFRTYLLEERNYKKAISLIKSNQITRKNAFHYLIYMLNRKITKTCYPYRLR